MKSATPRCGGDLGSSADAGDLDLLAEAGEVLLRHVGEGRRHDRAVDDVRHGIDARFVRHGDRQVAVAEVHVIEGGHIGPRFHDDVPSGDPDVDRSLMHEPGNVGGAQEHDGQVPVLQVHEELAVVDVLQFEPRLTKNVQSALVESTLVGYGQFQRHGVTLGVVEIR
jgi:hypothetical protein